jgi:hypothetical protein
MHALYLSMAFVWRAGNQVIAVWSHTMYGNIDVVITNAKHVQSVLLAKVGRSPPQGNSFGGDPRDETPVGCNVALPYDSARYESVPTSRCGFAHRPSHPKVDDNHTGFITSFGYAHHFSGTTNPGLFRHREKVLHHIVNFYFVTCPCLETCALRDFLLGEVYQHKRHAFVRAYQAHKNKVGTRRKLGHVRDNLSKVVLPGLYLQDQVPRGVLPNLLVLPKSKHVLSKHLVYQGGGHHVLKHGVAHKVCKVCNARCVPRHWNRQRLAGHTALAKGLQTCIEHGVCSPHDELVGGNHQRTIL